MEEKNGTLVISLDFELLWGIFDKVDHTRCDTYFRNTLKGIPRILKLFEKFQISSTWATVGMLFNDDWQSWQRNIPSVLPQYKNRAISAYNFGDIKKLQIPVDFCFAPHLIDEISKVPGQEIATHTYSHYYCLEEGQTAAAFKADLEMNIHLAEKKGVKLRSLVFPRNQYNTNYLKICSDLGIRNVRSNPENWYWYNTRNDGIWQKVFRTGDAYVGPKNKGYKLSQLTKEDGFPLSQKASRLLRPYSSSNLLNKIKLERIFSEMTYAAKHKEIYHLWWHPHNFGNNLEENLSDLTLILEHYNKCREAYKFQSLNMDQIFFNI